MKIDRSASPRLLWLYAFLFLASHFTISTASSAGGGKPFILRVRQPDGSIQRVGYATPEKAQEVTLRQVLEQAAPSDQDESIYPCSVQVGSRCIPVSNKDDADEDNTLQALGIRHGALLAVLPGEGTPKKSTGLQQKKSTISSSSSGDDETKSVKRWNPFPDLAKDYETVKRQIKRRKNSAKLSFGDLSALHQALHTVEAQPTGSIYRFHLCQVAAERFAQATTAASNDNQPRVALLLGTLHRERQDLKRVRHKTSLSSTTEAEDYCQVAKVQAMWEPMQPSNSKYHYDAQTELLDYAQNEKVMNVAEWLGLVPVGWIYSYPELRHGDKSDDEDSLPVFGHDIQTGAKLQIAHMKRQLSPNAPASSTLEEAKRGFCTVAMHTPSGATEVFQLSDVAVQMVAEDMLVLDQERNEDTSSKKDDDSSSKKKKKKKSAAPSKPQRFVSTRHAVLVDGRETKKLDSVLCLVNTALLSHTGSYVGKGGSGVKKTNPYQLTKKTRKALAKALTRESAKLMEMLCNFNILVALYDDLSAKDMQTLVQTVRKWARGQKKTAVLDPKILKRLDQVLNT